MRKRKVKTFSKFLFFLGFFFFVHHCFLFYFPKPSSFLDIKNNLISYIGYHEKIKEEYFGILEIPKLGLQQPFYEERSAFNNVDKHVYLVPGSTMPWEEYSNLILAAHSGNSSVSYFRNLDQVAMKDIATLLISGKSYTYQLVSIYTEKKDGTITIHREPKKNNLTLITCDRENKDQQLVFIFEFIYI